MKAVLLLAVLFCGVLTIRAAAVPVEEEPKPEEELIEFLPVEPAVEPVVPEVADPEVVPVEEELPSLEGRFFACPTGWSRYKSGCYSFVRSSRSWSSATSYCNSFGASLPSVHDLFEYSFLQDLTRRESQTTSWLGGFYFQTWRWVDQTPFVYSNWNYVYSSASYPCLYLNYGVGWSNSNCATSRTFICVKKTDTC